MYRIAPGTAVSQGKSARSAAARSLPSLRMDSGKGLCETEVMLMLWTIFVILLVLWLVGLVSSATFGGWIHLLLVIAAVVLVFQLLSGRRVV